MQPHLALEKPSCYQWDVLPDVLKRLTAVSTVLSITSCPTTTLRNLPVLMIESERIRGCTICSSGSGVHTTCGCTTYSISKLNKPQYSMCVSMLYMTTLRTTSYQNSQCFTRKISRTTLRMMTIGRYFRINACRTSTTLWQDQTNLDWRWQQKRLHTAISELVYGLASTVFDS